jgi:hypothetical protein
MSPRALSSQRLQQIQTLAAQWGKIVARQVDSTTALDFQAMEQIASAAASGLIEGTLATLLGQQTQTVGAQQPCPECGVLCPVTLEDHPLEVQGAVLIWHEPVCHCPACRRDFFPPTDCSTPGQPSL